MASDFVWADLSALDLGKAKRFYRDVLGWRYSGTSDYTYANAGGKASAGLFTMPEKFQHMGLPSFWMSYIAVPDVQEVVERARHAGGIIEVEPSDYKGLGMIALIRDTAGAGFTVIQDGPTTPNKASAASPGFPAHNELHVSDATKVISFYEAVFGWRFTPVGPARFDVVNEAGQVIAALEQIPTEIKGKFEYWAVYFTVKDVDTAINTAVKRGGVLLVKDATDTGTVALLQDPDGAMFMLMGQEVDAGWSLFGGKSKTIIALFAVYLAVMFSRDWAWGALFLVWLIPDLRSGTTYFVEPVERSSHPLLYWLIMLSWLWISLFLIIGFFFRSATAG